jgi:hypothetical protein
MRPRRSPLGKGADHNLDNGPLTLGLTVGFAVSGVAVFGAAWLLGHWIRPTSDDHDLLTLLSATLVLLGLADLADGRVSVFRRQTPERLLSIAPPSVVGLFWGLDTGLVFTTFRTSAASWAALACAFWGFLPWWAGTVYAASFVVPTIALSVFNRSYLWHRRVATSPRLARLASLDLADLEQRVFSLRRRILALAAATLSP